MDCRTGRGSLLGSDQSPKKLILAAADCAEFDTPPPPELVLAWQVQRWGAPAVFAGEIPAHTLKLMAAAANVHAAFESYKAGSARFADWAQAHPTQFGIVADVREMRKQLND